MIARYLAEQGQQVIPLTRNEFDVAHDDAQAFLAKYALTPHDVVLNAIGVTDHPAGSTPEALLFRVNAEFPKELDAIAKQSGCVLLHASTDGVFAGSQGGYWESSVADATDLYGRSKHAGEQLPSSIVVRTSLIGPERERAQYLLEWVRTQKNQTVRGYTNHTWNGITTLTYAKIVEHFLVTQFPEHGLYHLFSPSVTTKYDLIRAIGDAYDIPLAVIPHHTPVPVLRHLVSEKELCASLALPDIKEQLGALHAYERVWRST